MLKYVVKRVVWIISVILGVLFIIFLINYVTPGDPVVADSNYTQEQYDLKEAELGLITATRIYYIQNIQRVM